MSQDKLEMPQQENGLAYTTSNLATRWEKKFSMGYFADSCPCGEQK
jgi:hypothetical protein